MGLLGHSCRSIYGLLRASSSISVNARRVLSTALTLGALSFGMFFSAAHADPSRLDSPSIDGRIFTNVYRWNDSTSTPKAAVIAVHGLTMHGTVFEALARHLAGEGIVVYAPDLRGYGAWQTDRETVHKSASSPQDSRSKIAYQASCEDLVDLITSVKNDHPNLPLYLVGESLGADIAMVAAGKLPETVDGLIVSSPAIKRKMHFEQMSLDFGKAFTSARLTISTKPYIKYFASEDQRISAEALNDPLVRKRLSAKDILQTFKFIDSSLKFADTVPDKTPVLVLQGDKDDIIDSSGVLKLAQHLTSTDQTIKWFKGKGHLLLETSFISDKTFTAVDQWIDRQVSGSEVQMPLAVSLHKNLAYPLEEQLASQ